MLTISYLMFSDSLSGSSDEDDGLQTKESVRQICANFETCQHFGNIDPKRQRHYTTRTCPLESQLTIQEPIKGNKGTSKFGSST